MEYFSYPSDFGDGKVLLVVWKALQLFPVFVFLDSDVEATRAGDGWEPVVVKFLRVKGYVDAAHVKYQSFKFLRDLAYGEFRPAHVRELHPSM